MRLLLMILTDFALLIPMKYNIQKQDIMITKISETEKIKNELKIVLFYFSKGRQY